MTPQDLIATITAAGGEVVNVNGSLRIKAPAGLLSDQERSLLVEHKAGILKLLAPAVETVVSDLRLPRMRGIMLPTRGLPANGA